MKSCSYHWLFTIWINFLGINIREELNKLNNIYLQLILFNSGFKLSISIFSAFHIRMIEHAGKSFKTRLAKAYTCRLFLPLESKLENWNTNSQVIILK